MCISWVLPVLVSMVKEMCCESPTRRLGQLGEGGGKPNVRNRIRRAVFELAMAAKRVGSS